MLQSRSRALILSALGVVYCAETRAGAGNWFEDVTQAAGVWERHSQLGEVPPVSSSELLFMVAGAAVGDFDNDGWPDVYVTRLDLPNSLYRNQGDGTFVDVAPAAGVAVVSRSSGAAWGDVNNDGLLDLYVLTLTRSGQNFLYINHGDGTFTEEALARGLDCISGPALRQYTSAVFGDPDLDGDLDVLTLAWQHTGTRGVVHINDGTGHFTPDLDTGALLQIGYGFSGAFADINNDDWPDLLVAGDFRRSRLLINQGSGVFYDASLTHGACTDENGMGSAVGDIDNDGDLDWFVTAIYDPIDTCGIVPCGWGASGNRLYQNAGDGTFLDVTTERGVRDGYWGWGAAMFDFDNDGDLDLGMTNGVDLPNTDLDVRFRRDPMCLWENAGAGQMPIRGPDIGFDDPRSGKALSVFDFDNDGDLDVFVANSGEEPQLLRNNALTDRHWLRVKLRGAFDPAEPTRAGTNHFGIGARVYVRATPDGPTQMRELGADGGYLSQNEMVAHFGLDAATRVHELRVHWPASGVDTVYRDVAADQTLTLHELLCPGDINADRFVGMMDLGLLLGAYGTISEDGPLAGDFNGDQVVGLSDLAMLLANFNVNCQ